MVDFLVLKKLAVEECSRLHFRTLLPECSDCLDIVECEGRIEVSCEDGNRFVLPRQDVCLLPIVHSSSEELAQYLVARLRQRLAGERNSIETIEVSIEDIPGQLAVCREAFDADKADG